MPGCRSRDDFAGKPFAFIHVPKTAGVSITQLLEPYAEPLYTDYSLLESIVEGSLDLLGRHHGVLHWHMFYADVERYYGAKTMTSLHSFAFIRNPWDWLVSYYTYLRQTQEHYEHMIVGYMTFEQFLRFWKTKRLQQWDWVRSGERLGVKKLYRLEDAETAVAELGAEIGVSLAGLPQLNTSKRAPYQDYYTERSARMVREICPADIELGGYDF